MHPSDLADILEDLAPAEREVIFTSLDEEVAAEALEEVEPKLQKALLEKLDDEILGDIDEVEAFGKEAADQRYPETLLGVERKFALLDADVPIALDTLHNLSQRGVLVFQRSHQKTGL